MKRTIINMLLLLAAGWLLVGCDSEGDKFDYQKVGLLITGTEQVPVQRFTVDELPAAYAVTVKSGFHIPDTTTQFRIVIRRAAASSSKPKYALQIQVT